MAKTTKKGVGTGNHKNHAKGRAPANKSAAPAHDKIFDSKVRKAKKDKADGKKPRKNFRGKKVDINTYNIMYEAYIQEQSIAHVSRVSGINPKTAKKFIEEGDPTRNLRPLKTRYESVINKEQDKEDYTLAKHRSEMQNVGRVLMNKVAVSVASIDPDDIDPNRVDTMLKNIQVLIERTLGVADATVAHKDESRYADWSLEELETFVKTGVTPDHDRSVAPVDANHGVTRDE